MRYPRFSHGLAVHRVHEPHASTLLVVYGSRKHVVGTAGGHERGNLGSCRIVAARPWDDARLHQIFVDHVRANIDSLRVATIVINKLNKRHVGICQRKAIHGGDAELLPERRCSRRVHYRPELSRVATDDELLDALHVRSAKSRLDGLGAFVENENVRLEEVLLAQLVDHGRCRGKDHRVAAGPFHDTIVDIALAIFVVVGHGGRLDFSYPSLASAVFRAFFHASYRSASLASSSSMLVL
jgi:hypothetical protein